MWIDKLREMKAASNLTTKEIAAQSGIPEPTLEKLFAGATKEPKLQTIRQLVHFLGYTLDDLEDAPTKKNPCADESAQGETIDKQIMNLVGQMTVPQKNLLLALLRTAVLQNQGTPASDLASIGGAMPKFEHQGPA